MSAVVFGKRSLFEEIHSPVQKRLRCGGSSSPVRCVILRSDTESPLSTTPSVDPAVFLSQLKGLFPDMDEQLIEKVLESTGDNLESAIKSLNDLRLSSYGGHSSCLLSDTNIPLSDGSPSVSIESSNKANGSQEQSFPSEGTKWVEMFVREMAGAINLGDAKERATTALKAFEEAMISGSGFLTEKLQQENTLLKEQLQSVVRENHILKRAVAIQHERQVEHENCLQELHQLKQLITQYQEQIRSLELNNYALTLHLQRAQGGSSIPGRFHPDVF